MKQSNKICAFIVSLMIPAGAMECVAQDDYSKQKTEITSVKRSPDSYVFAEATCKTPEEAQAVAEELFYQNVNEYVASQKKLKGASDIVINDAKSLKNEVSMPRGTNMYRVFIYVKKNEIMAMNNPVIIQPTPAGADTPDTTSPESAAGADEGRQIPECVKELSTVKTVGELNTVLKRMKQNGSVAAYDKYNNLSVKSEWYLVIYDATGTVRAVLTDGAERVNVATGQADSVKNYPKHAAIGVKVKK